MQGRYYRGSWHGYYEHARTLLGAPGIATRSKDATGGSCHHYYSSKDATWGS